MTANLVLHWPLDDVSGESIVLDTSPAHRNGRVEPGADIRPDPRFGSALALDANTGGVTVAGLPIPALYTAELWVRASRPQASVTLLGHTGGLALSVTSDGAVQHSLPGGSAAFRTGPGAIAFGEWRHVAATGDGTTARTYVDGVETASMPWPVAEGSAAGILTVGSAPRQAGEHLAGSVAHVRIHDDALDPAQLRRGMAGDESDLAAFVRTHPIAFTLLNVDEQPVLYIENSAAGQLLTLRLVNASREDIELRPTRGVVSADVHHVSLRWRQGTLDLGGSGVRPVATTAGWSARLDPGDPAGPVLYLAGPGGTRIPAGGAITVELDGVRVDGAAGTRGTRVELRYRRLGHRGDRVELTGTRHQTLEIVNHRGRPDLPLAVGFLDGGRVLSDGRTPATLRLRLANVSRTTPITFSAGTAGGPPSTVLVSFEVQLAGEEWAWALADTDGAGATTLTVSRWPVQDQGWRVDPPGLGEARLWTLTPLADTVLPAGESMELTLGPVLALPTPGHAPVVVAYRDLPGFRNGQITVEVERSPLLFDPDGEGFTTGRATVRTLTIGGVSIGEAELRVLQLLAAGRLEVDLLNVAHGGFAYAADVGFFDIDRHRHVVTSPDPGPVGPPGRWRVIDPS